MSTTARPAHDSPSAWTPLRHAPFRAVWLSWLIVMVAFWTNELAAAWTMAAATRSPLLVTLVPAAGTLPIFLFATLAGTLADIVERRRIVWAAQAVAVASQVLLFLLLQFDALTPGLLLAVLLVHGSAFAFRLPSFAAAVSDTAPKAEVAKAISLNTLATNLARVIGPLLGGSALVVAGPKWVFLGNAVLGSVVLLTVARWPASARSAASLPGERLLGAVRLGFRFVRATPAVLLAVQKGALFFFFSVVSLALLPVLASSRFPGSASTFSLLMAAFGLGAVLVALSFARLRARWCTEPLFRAASIVNVLACVLLAAAQRLDLTLLACVLAGGSWMGVASATQIVAQSALPNWVRARGIAVFQTAVMGASAFGAIAWGTLASHTALQWALYAAALVGAASTALLWRRRLADAPPSHTEVFGGDIAGELAVPVAPEKGPVVIAIRFRVPPPGQPEFLALMAESRASRLRHGAISWSLLQDSTDAEVFVEHFIFESWADRLRQIDHATQADEELRRRKRALCSEPPTLHRWVSQQV